MPVFSSYYMCGVYICNLKLVISFRYRHFLNWQGFYKLKIHGNKENSSFSSSLSFGVDSEDLGRLFPFLELLSLSCERSLFLVIRIQLIKILTGFRIKEPCSIAFSHSSSFFQCLPRSILNWKCCVLSSSPLTCSH